MKRILMISLALGAALSFCACAKNRGVGDPVARQGGDIPQPMPAPGPKCQINGMAPDDFYRQFLYQLTDSCAKSAIYKYPTSEIVKVGVNSKGQDILAELSIFMKEDHTFQAFYLEMDVRRYTPSGVDWKIRRTKVVRGFWWIVEDRLELPGLGVAVGAQSGRSPVMHLTMNTDLVTHGLNNHTLTLTLSNYVSNFVPIPSLNPCQ